MTNRAPLDMDHAIEIRLALKRRIEQCERDAADCRKSGLTDTADYWQKASVDSAAALVAFDATVKFLDDQGL